MKSLVATLFALLVAGCATYKDIPENYAGPRAEVMDSIVKESPASAQVFALVQIDGHPIPQSIEATGRATGGSVLGIHSEVVGRNVRVRPMQVRLKAQHMATAFQGFALLAQGKFYHSYEGTVDFHPRPDGKYVVKGEMGSSGIAVWIEDAVTGELVTTRVTKN